MYVHGQVRNSYMYAWSVYYTYIYHVCKCTTTWLSLVWHSHTLSIKRTSSYIWSTSCAHGMYEWMKTFSALYIELGTTSNTLTCKQLFDCRNKNSTASSLYYGIHLVAQQAWDKQSYASESKQTLEDTHSQPQLEMLELKNFKQTIYFAPVRMYDACGWLYRKKIYGKTWTRFHCIQGYLLDLALA